LPGLAAPLPLPRLAVLGLVRDVDAIVRCVEDGGAAAFVLDGCLLLLLLLVAEGAANAFEAEVCEFSLSDVASWSGSGEL